MFCHRKNGVRVVCISDTHEQASKLSIPECDLLIVAGDITHRGHPVAVQNFNNWAAMLQDTDRVGEVILIAGNHDLLAEKDPETWKKLLPDVTYLQDSLHETCGLRIYGSPWTPSFFRQFWVFNADRGEEIARHWEKIPDGLDILITHGPPAGIQDKNDTMQNCGCGNLLNVVMAKEPRVHVFGHIHNGHGIGLLGRTMCVNAAICPEAGAASRALRNPICFEL